MCRLVATDVEVPRNVRHIGEVLAVVDVDIAVFVDGFFYDIVAVFGIFGDVLFDAWAFQ